MLSPLEVPRGLGQLLDIYWASPLPPDPGQTLGLKLCLEPLDWEREGASEDNGGVLATWGSFQG